MLEVSKVVNLGQGGGGGYCLKQTMGRKVLWWDSKVLFCDLDTFTFTQLCKVWKLIVSVNYTLFYMYAYILYFNKSLKNWIQPSKYVSFSGNPCSFFFLIFKGLVKTMIIFITHHDYSPIYNMKKIKKLIT